MTHVRLIALRGAVVEPKDGVVRVDGGSCQDNATAGNPPSRQRTSHVAAEVTR